jgi:hypothetical protein
MTTATAAPLEYQNDFFSIKISPLKHRSGAYHYSIGLNLPKFNPIIWGRTGICSNAAFKGLQQLRADVSSFAIQRGIMTKTAEGSVGPTGRLGHGWYQESALLLEGASTEDIPVILEFGARNLIRTILTASHPDVKVPDGPLDPEVMQRFLESVGVPNYREVAPPPIAKAQAAAA